MSFQPPSVLGLQRGMACILGALAKGGLDLPAGEGEVVGQEALPQVDTFSSINRGLVWESCFQKVPESLSSVLNHAWPAPCPLRDLEAL